MRGNLRIGRRLPVVIVSLLADGDVPGHKAMEALAAHLCVLGCRVKIALPPTIGAVTLLTG